MLSVFLGALGLGALGIGLGLLVDGPLALDRRLDAPPPPPSSTDALDLHADRRLGSLEGGPDILWRPMLSPHFWTVAVLGFGACGTLLQLRGAGPGIAIGASIGLGLVLGWAVARVLRSLPPRARE